MQNYFISRDIIVFYVQAGSFPNGVLKAHQTVQDMLPSVYGRNLFGISYPQDGQGIIYKACVEEAYEGEAASLSRYTIREGEYISCSLTDWKKDESSVGRAFAELLSNPKIDPEGYCLELYPNDKDMICLVPLAGPGPDGDREEKLLTAIRDTFLSLNNTIAAFPQEQFNRVPFAGSWTPAQVAGHIIKFSSGLPDGRTGPTSRRDDEKVEMLEQLFRDDLIKMHSPDFILPGKEFMTIRDVVTTFKEIQTMLEGKVEGADLGATCLDVEVPVFGYLTRYEWLKFIVVHAQRHIRQLKNMLVLINGDRR